MKLKPKKFTQLHVDRLYHLSRFVTFALICVVILTGTAGLFMSAQADQNSIQAEPVSVGATVPEFTSPSTTPESGGGGGGVVTFPTPTPPTPTQAPGSLPFFFAAAKNFTAEDSRNINGQAVTVYYYHNNTPEIYGKAEAGAIIYLDISGPTGFTSTTLVDGKGDWDWLSPLQLEPGAYSINVTAKSQPDQQVVGQATLYIMATGPRPAAPATPIIPPQGKPGPWYVLLSVLPEDKQVVAGGLVKAEVWLEGLNAHYIILDYRVLNSLGSVVFEMREQVAQNGSKFLKTFYINPETDAGNYTIQVTAESGNNFSTAGDTFKIVARPAAVITQTTTAKTSTTIFWWLILLLALFAIIMYLEYRKVMVLSRYIRQVEEEDLKKDDMIK